MNMPRCCKIMKEIFHIPISLSSLYTYTDNARKGSLQAHRHHELKPGTNPGIRLKRSTRDGHGDRSINSHYATVDMKYTLFNMFERGAAILARDNKALVHTDVEIVQRPKSWKRIQYSDHDWNKDSKRTITITTYQFVKKKEISEEVMISELAGIPACTTRLQGPAVSLVKATYFEKSTAFRHLNETLFIMSLPQYTEHFTSNGKFTTELLVTVDGGGDERPRNKLTRFLDVLFRLCLKLDRYKVKAYAEGDSKLHSVEVITLLRGGHFLKEVQSAPTWSIVTKSHQYYLMLTNFRKTWKLQLMRQYEE